MDTARHSTAQATRDKKALRIGCVSYLNAKPLIHGIDDQPDSPVRFDVPSGLLDDLESGSVDIALCPVIDFHRSRVPLKVVPAGCIGCDGPTMTVRLFSQIPLDEVDEIHADMDSHTSIALLRVTMQHRLGRQPTIIAYNAREQVAENRVVKNPRTVLLIGDKVVTAAPDESEYPFTIDLGEAWKQMTGLPFVFAIWMARDDATLGDLPQRLAAVRVANLENLGTLIDHYAPKHGWPSDLAHRYLGQCLKFGVGEREIQAMETFGQLAAEHGVIDKARPLLFVN